MSFLRPTPPSDCSWQLGGALIDAEIAGQRTMLIFRADLRVKKLHFRLENAELRNVRAATLRN